MSEDNGTVVELASPPFSPPSPPSIPPPSPPPPGPQICDPNANLPSKTEYAADPRSAIRTLTSTPIHDTLCDQRWLWFRIPTLGHRERPVATRLTDIFGVTQTVDVPEQYVESHAVVVQFEGKWTVQNNRFPTSDIMVVNGVEALPDNWNAPNEFDPDWEISQSWMPHRIQWRRHRLTTASPPPV
jgi:hypothetical protein